MNSGWTFFRWRCTARSQVVFLLRRVPTIPCVTSSAGVPTASSSTPSTLRFTWRTARYAHSKAPSPAREPFFKCRQERAIKFWFCLRWWQFRPGGLWWRPPCPWTYCLDLTWRDSQTATAPFTLTCMASSRLTHWSEELCALRSGHGVNRSWTQYGHRTVSNCLSNFFFSFVFSCLPGILQGHE